jgi:hydrogenase/urease accessory protein HupE
MSVKKHHIIFEKQSNTAAKISISLAILGFVFSLIPFLGWFLLPVWIMAILFGIVGLFKSYKRGLAISGILIGVMTFMYKIVFLQTLFGS